jgi:hypothetical protein
VFFWRFQLLIVIYFSIKRRSMMIAKNRNLQKSLLVLLILILPVSIFTYIPITAQSPHQDFATEQGGTQGFARGNTTDTHTGSHNNPHISTGNSSTASAYPGNPNTATVNGD